MYNGIKNQVGLHRNWWALAVNQAHISQSSTLRQSSTQLSIQNTVFNLAHSSQSSTIQYTVVIQHTVVNSEHSIQSRTQYPANMRRWLNVGLLLAHRLRRWPNSKPTLGQRLMFAG